MPSIAHRLSPRIFRHDPDGPPMPSVVVDGELWPVNGAQVAVVDSGRVLVQFRPWPPGWELPGGHVDRDEDPAVAAARECQEETGYRVNILGLVGVYTWEGLRSAGDAVYLAEITGGRRQWNLEAWVTRFVAPADLPRTLFPWCNQRIMDALARAEGEAPVHRVQPITMYHVANFATQWMREPVDSARAWWKRHRSPY
jgi:8-oxo-dGTP pyrophosphatase MutT (NUDIX family)